MFSILIQFEKYPVLYFFEGYIFLLIHLFTSLTYCPNGNQFTMEMAGTEFGNIPKSYSLNMFKDFVPMGVFSETSQGEDLVHIY